MGLSAAERQRMYRERHPERIALAAAKRWPEYYERNKEKIKARVAAWQKANPDKERAKHNKWNAANRDRLKVYQDNYRKKNPVAYLYNLAKSRAAKLGREFTIELSDLSVPQECPLLGIPINAWSRDVDFRPSIDRIDSSKGYVKGNTWIVSHRANRIKNNANGDELMTLAINLLKAQGELP